MQKTVDQILTEYRTDMKNRVKTLKETANSILFNPKDPDFQKVQVGTSFYNGHPDKYPNGAEMTYCNIFVYLLLIRLGKMISGLLGINPKNGERSPYYTPINLFIQNCIAIQKLYGKVKELTWQEGVNIARFGGVVMVCQPEVLNANPMKSDFGHMAVIYPDDEIPEAEKDILVIGAGSRIIFGISTMKKAFLDYGYKPRYFHIVEN